MYKSIFLTILSIFLLTACSSKPKVTKEDINKFYKPNYNKSIKNSKAVHRATLRSYVVFGKRYHPFVPKMGEEFKGIASWYGPNFHAKKTSNGETYNMYALTAAHKELPMNTIVKVDNLENGKSVIVRINDRGPFVAGRIIDLSNKAAHAIDMVGKGTAKVKIKVLGFNGQINNSRSPIAQLPKKKYVPVKKTVIKKTQAVMNKGNYSLQVGAFRNVSGAEKTRSKYREITNKNVIIQRFNDNGLYLYKVFVKSFISEASAMDFKIANDLNNAIIIKE